MKMKMKTKMKTKILICLTLCTTLALFSSCKKDDPKVDAREKFVGTWKGEISYPNVLENPIKRYVVVKKIESTSNKITFTNFSSYDGFASITGTVNESTVTFDQWTDKIDLYLTTDDKTSTPFAFTHKEGTGNISGSTLTTSGKVDILNESTSKSATRTWTCVWTKQ